MLVTPHPLPLAAHGGQSPPAALVWRVVPIVGHLDLLLGLGGQHPLCLCREGLQPGCRGLTLAYGRHGRLYPRQERNQRRRLGCNEGLPLLREIAASLSRLQTKRLWIHMAIVT